MSNENKNTNVKEETTWTNFKFFNNQVKLKVIVKDDRQMYLADCRFMPGSVANGIDLGDQNGISGHMTVFLTEKQNSNEGLVVDVYWYDAKIHDKDNAVTSLNEKKNATLNNALLKASTRIRLISKRELEDVAKITLDGELVEWRQGGELVNGVKFFSQELLYFSNGRSASITERACKISQFIKNANPELPDEIIAGWMGLPPTVLETMKRDQLRNDQVSEQDD